MLSFNMLVKTICLIVFIPFFISNIKKRHSLFQHAVFLAFFVYLCIVAKVVFFPVPIDTDFIKQFIDTTSINYNLIPMSFLINNFSENNLIHSLQIRESAKNVLLFLPMGFLLPLVLRMKVQYKRIVYIGALVSISIELFQLLLDFLLIVSYRVVDINDIIMNTLGTIIGLGLLLSVEQIARRFLRISIKDFVNPISS